MSLSISPNSVLVVIGSGPGIGLATAIHFASHGFRKVALVSRNAERLQKDREAVIHAVNQASNKEIEVKTWSTDITVTSELKKTLSEVQEMGDVKCVHFNAARVSPSAFFEFDEETLGNDFATQVTALYTTARWAVPLLQSSADNAAFLVTNSHLWREPYGDWFALSSAKAAQRNLVTSLKDTFQDVHFALVNPEGIVSPEDPVINPKNIASKFWDVFSQSKEEWGWDFPIRPE